MNKEEIQKAIDEFVNSFKQSLSKFTSDKALEELKKKCGSFTHVDLSQFTTEEYLKSLWKK